MFYSFDEVPQPPKLDFKTAQLKDPSNFQQITTLLESRNQIVKYISQLSKNEQPNDNIDPGYISALLPLSIDLVR
jgi:hypothetical protein